jgi:hypothetical protein
MISQARWKLNKVHQDANLPLMGSNMSKVYRLHKYEQNLSKKAYQNSGIYCCMKTFEDREHFTRLYTCKKNRKCSYQRRAKKWLMVVKNNHIYPCLKLILIK